MRAKSFTVSILLCLSACMSMAQMQQGYVKTLGRPEKAGVPLGGVIVRVKGVHNTVLSKEDGTFSMTLTGKKNGDAYALQQVQKSGYELNEKEVIGRQYAFSDKVPLTIVMVSMAQLQADKQRISENAFRVAERNYKARMAMLEKQMDEHAISMEKYREDIRDLQDKFEKYQSMIDGLAEHYAHTDYDELDEKDREINICIENGDLERADSLIRLLFDPIDVLKRNKEALAKIEQQEAQAHDMIAQANADMAAVMKQQEKDAEYLYQLYTIALAKFDNDKALQYIETRAALDTTNVEWQLKAGSVLRDVGLLERAFKYNYRALYHAKQAKKYNYLIGAALNNIGDLYIQKDQYKEAIIYLEEAETSDIKEFGKDNKVLVLAYNNLGLAYESMDDFLKSKEYYEKAYLLASKFYPAVNKHTAILLNNMAGLNSSLGDKKQAVKQYQQSLEIYRKVVGEESKEVAMVYLNLGDFYGVSNNSLALDYIQKSYDIYKKIYGEHHPNIARYYSKRAGIYGSLEQYEQAINYLNKAYQILKDFYGEKHSEIAVIYDLFSTLYMNQKQYDLAHDYNQKAQDVYSSLFGTSHHSIANCLMSKSSIYLAQGKLDEAENVINQALNMRIQIFGHSHPDIAVCYSILSTVYLGKNNPQQANNYIDKAISVMEERYPEGHPSLQTYYMLQGTGLLGKMTEHFIATGELNDYGAEEYFNKALGIAEKFYQNDNDKIQESINMLVSCYFAKYAITKKISPNDTTYLLKLKKLNEKYPQYVKQAIETLNTNGSIKN